MMFLAIVLSAGCAGSSKPNGTADDPSSDGDPVESPSGVREDPIEVAPPQPTHGAAPGTPSEHELTHGDCQALGGKYRDLTMSDQLAKLDPSVTQAQREQAKTSVEKAAGIVAEKWTASCEGSLVGKFTDESWLTCAMSSKTVAAFDQCLNGGPPK